VSSLANEGPVNVMYNIIKYIDFTLFEVSMITFIPEKKSSRLADFEKFPIRIFQLAKSKKISPVAMFKSLKKTVLKIDPDELHAHCPRSLYLMCFLPKRYKRIYTIHIYPGLQQQILYGRIKGNIVIVLNNYFTRKCDLPIGCAESVGVQYKKEKGWNIFCIPNGASLSVWEKNEAECQSLRKEFGLDENVKYFIFIGRFSKEKNPDVLVDAFNTLAQEDVKLIMLGKGPMWEDLYQRKGDNVLMPGFTTRVYDYLKAVDYYISASDVEGLANTLLESMSVGLPMLLSDIPSHQEVLAKFEKYDAGIIIRQRDVKSVRECINKILKCDKIYARSIIQSVFKQYYTAKNMSEKYQIQYNKLKQ
jgi:glycosyltransferase involved in cell wall biosynthesis